MAKARRGMVLDTSAVLAFVQQEPGAERVRTALEDECMMSAVNHIEVLSKLLDWNMSPEEAADVLLALEIRTISLDAAQATQAAWLRGSTRHLGLSLGDRACLALALSQQATVLTADRAWLGLSLDVAIESIRP